MREIRNASQKTELPIIDVSDCMVCFIILYLTTKNERTREIFQKVYETFGDRIITEQQIGNWRHTFFKPGTHANQTVHKPDMRMCGQDYEHALCHLRMVHIPFVANQNLSVFTQTQKELWPPGISCLSQVRRKSIYHAPRANCLQTIWFACVYRPLECEETFKYVTQYLQKLDPLY